MMIDPPIDKLVKKAAVVPEEEGGCKYTLCCVVSKRARALKEQQPAVLEESHEKPISYAAKELYNGHIRPTIG